ncbi:MAG TPA: VIT1/CCC1 transporter family protein [Candidatus Doudnabacteria bacterium]|nr:VIT1/CCC1 transporter family protein [Candidatus Doudnabacteria bacterium]
MRNKDRTLFVRNFTFGVEDSLVSTVGLLAGIAVAGVDQRSIIITGLVLIFVEAFSMAVGSLISERSVEEYQAKATTSLNNPVRGSIIMFFSYVIAGFIPLAPYFYSTGNTSVILSVVLTLLALFILGAVNAKMFRAKVWKDGLFTLIMGGLAILVGIVVGQVAGKF